MESAGYGAAWLKIAVWPKMDRVVPFGDIAIFEKSSSSMKSSAPCQTVWPRQDPIAPASTTALNLGVLPRGSVDNRRVDDSHFQTLLAHVSAKALYCDSERPNLGCSDIGRRRIELIAAFIERSKTSVSRRMETEKACLCWRQNDSVLASFSTDSIAGPGAGARWHNGCCRNVSFDRVEV